MRYVLLWVPLMLGAADLKVDHVTVCGSDLKAMQVRLSSVGRRSEFGGAHSNHATEMSITSFPDGSYLELIAIQAKADPAAVEAHYWKPYMKGEAGPCAWAVRTDDVAKEAARLKAAGVQVSATARAGRAKPDGTRLEWETANVGPEANGVFFPFMIRDLTDREKRAFVSAKPTMAEYSGIGRVVIAVKDLASGVERYRKAYALGKPVEVSDPGLGARMAVFEGSPVVIATAAGKGFVAERIAKFGEGPCAFVLGKGGSGGWRVKWMDSGKLGWWLGTE